MLPTKPGVPAIITLLLTHMVKAAPIAAGSTHPSQSATAVTVTVIERDTPSPTPEVIAGASVTGMVVFLLFCFYCYERWKKRRNARRTRDKDTAFETAARIGVERYKLAAAKNVAAQDGRTN